MGTSATSGSDASGAGERAAGLLAATEGLRARTRTQVNGSWVPLLGFGLLALAAAPIAEYAYNFGAHGRYVVSYPAFAYAELTGLCVVHEPGTPCLQGEFDGAVLRFAGWGVWFALLPLAWIACARWYRVRGEKRGVVPRLWGWAGVVAVAAVAVAAALGALLFGRNQPWEVEMLEATYATPWYLVGIGLLALGLTERSWATAAAGVAHALLLTGYLSASWGTGWLPWVHPAQPGALDGPGTKALLLAAVLLVPGLVLRAAARRRTGPVADVPRTVVP
ncbi:hypothetical protein STHAL_09295 [Streptomyces halstedii]|uniref:ABC transporter permease n=1 Tax=Streptomyces halstedii TaxID=1944 RepID=A0ABS6TN31_STRHA|nr:hypothetical protein [Streptomyces halstedii]MBV7669678.1 hypothetical protein [Streptomyces halstedii]